MEKNCLISVCIVSLTLASGLTQVINGQNTLVWKEVPSDTLVLNDEIPEGKALFVFEGKDGFNFESDATLIEGQKRDGSLYKFLINIEPSSGGLTIKHKGIYSNNYIPWGKDNSISLPPLQNKEVKFFKLTLYTTVDCIDVTPQTVKSGSTYFQALYEKEALIVLNVVPSDMNLTISGSEITKIVPDEGIYKVYAKPVGQQILLKSNNYDDYILNFEDDQLQSKEVRYYHVQPPPSAKRIETFDSNIKMGSYTIESTPVGALIQIIGNKAFNEQNLRTPYTIGNYKEGKETITLALDRYETVMDTILISSTEGTKSTYNLIPNFAFINCHIEPSIPNSIILMDGKELSLIENDKDYECPKGFHHLEIDAPGYYSEIRQVSFAAGKTHEIDVKLKPNTGLFPDKLSNGQPDVNEYPPSGLEYQSGGAGYQSGGTRYQPVIPRYQPTPAVGYQRSKSTMNQRASTAVYRNAPAVVSKSAKSTLNQQTPSARYQPVPSEGYKRITPTVNQRTPSSGYQHTQGTETKSTTSPVNQQTSAPRYQSVPAAFSQNAASTGNKNSTPIVNQRTPAARYKPTPPTLNQRTSTTRNQETPSSGYQQTPVNTPATGFKSSTPAVNQRTPVSGYQQTHTNAPAVGYKRTTSTVKKITPTVPVKKFNYK